MKLTVTRRWASRYSTIGELDVNGVFECFTLEDVVRATGVKIPGQTAIPAGTYRMIVNQSRRFGRPMPLLCDVPGFSGVRIHSGNTAHDTEGCILVGAFREEDAVLHSRIAYERLFAKIMRAAASGEAMSVEVIDGEPR